MTLQDALDYRRWANSLFEESKSAKRIEAKEYYYLKEWLERFDRIINTFTCYPEHHNMYKRGFENLKLLCKSL